jgi:hypothetical protein
MRNITKLASRYEGETCSIVGTGPSLLTFAREDFEPGPVIAINDAAPYVEDLEITNPLFSMQKDGGDKRLCPNCGDGCGGVSRPRWAMLLVSLKESLNCFANYPLRYFFDTEMLAPSEHGAGEFSANVALMIAKLFGCARINLIGFDSVTRGNLLSIDGDRRPAYAEQGERMKALIEREGLEVKWIDCGSLPCSLKRSL